MKIACIYDPSIALDGIRPSQTNIEQLRKDCDILTFAQAMDLTPYDVVVNLHGNYFPKDAFDGLLAKLRNHAGLICVGGKTPFSTPVRADGTVERAQTGFHQQLNIHHSLVMKADRMDTIRANPDLPLLGGYLGCFGIQDTAGLIVRFTSLRDVATDDGSAGPMDAIMTPLVSGFGKEDRPMAAPAVLIENTKGDFAGGRWIFLNQELTLNFWQYDGAEMLVKLANFVAGGTVECIARTNYACYHPGEQPTLSLQLQRLSGNVSPATISIKIMQGDTKVWSHEQNLSTTYASQYITLPTDLRVSPGMYTYTTELAVQGEPVRTLHNGFWGYDSALLQSGEPLRCGRDYFMKGDTPHPIVGMTYMQSDVHRKFVDLPNVYLWDLDMAEMKRAGINMIRTGIWTGHRNVSFIDGLVREEALRAFDAMFHTAKLHDIPIVFNFFSFTPEAWEGANPYLDPRSIEAQKRFISAFVCRHAKSTGVSWDLINEPSLCTLHTNWKPSVNGDRFETKAWHTWLAQRHGNIQELQERWNMSCAELPSFAQAAFPAPEDFIPVVNHTAPQKAMRVHDYLLFQQYVHNTWAKSLVEAIRDAGSPAPVTVGQDEGLGAQRPSPLFYQEVVDYTTCHSWWLNDDLYWDGVFAKSHDKPSLIQETGIMYVQTADGKARRDQAEMRNLLERKYALAFASDQAGAVHWAWNINIYMDSFNEVNIGAILADGSQKLEADVSYDFGSFIGKVGHLFKERALPPVSIIFPYSNNFSIRDGAMMASKRAIRVLGYDMGVPVQAYGEYHLDRLPVGGLILLPCARSLSQQAWDQLMDRVTQGSTLLLTGPFSYDAYYHFVPKRSEQLGIKTRLVSIAREETLTIGQVAHRAGYSGTMFDWVDKEVVCDSQSDQLSVHSIGKGKVIFSPLPIELSYQDDTVAAVYQEAIKVSGISLPFAWVSGRKVGLLVKKLAFAQGNVWVLVSECAQDAQVSLRDTATGKVYRTSIFAGRATLFATDHEGLVLAAYRDVNVDCR